MVNRLTKLTQRDKAVASQARRLRRSHRQKFVDDQVCYFGVRELAKLAPAFGAGSSLPATRVSRGLRRVAESGGKPAAL